MPGKFIELSRYKQGKLHGKQLAINYYGEVQQIEYKEDEYINYV